MQKDDDLYIIQSDVTGAIKIGRSKNPSRRLKELQTGSTFKLKLILVLPGQGRLEKQLHRQLRKWKCHGGEEWFSFTAVDNLPQQISDKLDSEMVGIWWESDKFKHLPGT